MDCLAQKLESLLHTEAALFEEAHQQVEEIKAELAAMNSFLEDSDGSKAIHSKSKQTQVAHVRDLVYDVEDIVDEFIYHRSKWQSCQSSRATFSGYVRTALLFPFFFWERRQIAAKLKEINSLIKAIPERNQRYHQVLRDEYDHQAAGNTAVFNAESALFLKEEDLVVIEPFWKLMVEWLTGGDSIRRSTISVVGMGGSGKTTLVANVFNSPAVKRCFDCVAWITVSQSFVIEDLLRSLIRELGIQTVTDQYRELVEKLVDYLEKKRYLVVLDDVWNANVWSQIKVWLPDGKNGSRIIITLPDHIDCLFNLRFLNLFGTPVKRLPNSIGRLQNLQTLDVVSTQIQALPKEVMELRKLRHLFTGYTKCMKLKDCNGLHGIKLAPRSDISTLKNLQCLRLVEASGHLMKQLRSMTQLVVLGISNLTGQAQMNDLCCSLKNMSLLQRLTIATGNDVEILRLDGLGRSPPLPRLQYLSLYGKLERFPRWICSLPSLIDLQMHRSCLPVEEDPLKHLHQLLSLSSIFLNNACEGTKLVFPTGFANLKTMALKNFGRLESITIAEGAMPGIKILQISSCMNLKTIPQGIEHLNELEQLRLENVPLKLIESICGPDRGFIRHIPLVRCHYYSSSGKYISKSLF